MNRRKMLAALGSAGLIGIAGCSSNGSEESGQNTPDDTPTSTSSNSDGGTTPTDTQSDEATETATETETATDATDSPTSTPLNLTNYPSCVPVSDEETPQEIFNLVPSSDETGEFTEIGGLGIGDLSDLERGTVFNEYRAPSGRIAVLGIFRYPSQSTARNNLSEIREVLVNQDSNFSVIGFLLSDNLLVAVAAQSTSEARSLVELYDITCFDNFVFIE